MWNGMITLYRVPSRKDTQRITSHRLAVLASSALAGLTLCLLVEPASATAGHACSAALTSRSRAEMEQFLRDYPLAGVACLARARTLQGFPFGGAGGRYGSTSNGEI